MGFRSEHFEQYITTNQLNKVHEILHGVVYSRGGGYSRQFRIGVCRQGSQTLTLFKGRKSRIDTLLKAQNQEMAPYLREKDNS